LGQNQNAATAPFKNIEYISTILTAVSRFFTGGNIFENIYINIDYLSIFAFILLQTDQFQQKIRGGATENFRKRLACQPGQNNKNTYYMT
jgi:hypothetical protein